MHTRFAANRLRSKCHSNHSEDRGILKKVVNEPAPFSVFESIRQILRTVIRFSKSRRHNVSWEFIFKQSIRCYEFRNGPRIENIGIYFFTEILWFLDRS